MNRIYTVEEIASIIRQLKESGPGNDVDLAASHMLQQLLDQRKQATTEIRKQVLVIQHVADSMIIESPCRTILLNTLNQINNALAEL